MSAGTAHSACARGTREGRNLASMDEPVRKPRESASRSADPHTLVLDEATSLIDPRTARHLEGSMAALLAGRTVMAIAHRLMRLAFQPS